MKRWFNGAVLSFALLGAGQLSVLCPRATAVPGKGTVPADVNQDAAIRSVAGRVDGDFDAAWAAAGVTPTGRADDLQIARRLSLALTGTIPSVEEIRTLEVQPADRRATWWVEHLLADRRSSDYLAERLARVLVGVEDGPFIVYRRHRLVSWLADQLQANRPYDALVRDLITSEGIWTTQPQVNFVTVTVDQNNQEEGPDEQKLAARVSRAFLGVRLDCVQCHDDKFGGRWKQRDFHQLAAFFAGAEMSLTGVRDKPAHDYHHRYLGKSEPELVPLRVPFDEALLPEDGPPRRRLASWVTHPENRAFARALVNRTWAQLFNRPLSRPVDRVSLDGPFPPGLELLADDLIGHGFDFRRLVRVIAATRVFQLDSRTADPATPPTPAQSEAFACFPLTLLRPEQVAGALLQSANLRTIDTGSHVLVRVLRFFQQNDFVKRYGDAGPDEFDECAGTITQRLVMMNGRLIHERTKEDLLQNAATRIGTVAPDNATAVEVSYLATLTRRPSPAEQAHFVERWGANVPPKRSQRMEDLFWTLLNSTEFSWNH